MQCLPGVQLQNKKASILFIIFSHCYLSNLYSLLQALFRAHFASKNSVGKLTEASVCFCDRCLCDILNLNFPFLPQCLKPGATCDSLSADNILALVMNTKLSTKPLVVVDYDSGMTG